MKKRIDVTARTIYFTFDELEPLSLNVADVTAANQTHAMLHGFMQRLGDAAAIPKSADNGYTVTEAMRREAVEGLIAHYTSGTEDWNLRTAARGPARNPVWVKLAEARGVDYDTIAAEKAAADLAELQAMGA